MSQGGTTVPKVETSVGSLPGLEPIVPGPLPDGAWPGPVGGAARIGIVGEVVAAIEPTTEGDPNAILIQLLAALGNVLGRKPHIVVDEKPHPLKVWAIVVGRTGDGKKGTGASRVFSLLDDVDPTWRRRRKCAIASGEAIVHEVRDDRERVRRVRDAAGNVTETAETILRAAAPGGRQCRVALLRGDGALGLRRQPRRCRRPQGSRGARSPPGAAAHPRRGRRPLLRPSTPGGDRPGARPPHPGRQDRRPPLERPPGPAGGALDAAAGGGRRRMRGGGRRCYHGPMLDEQDLRYYRSLAPGERLALALELSAWAWQRLDVPNRETGDRKWAAWLAEHDASNAALLAALRREARAAGEGQPQ